MITFLVNNKITDSTINKEVFSCFKSTSFPYIGVSEKGIDGTVVLDKGEFDVSLSLFNNRLSGRCSCGAAGLCVHEALLFEKYKTLTITSLPYIYRGDIKSDDLYLTLSKDRDLLARYEGNDGFLNGLLKDFKSDENGYRVIKGAAIEEFIGQLEKIREHVSVYVDDCLKKKNYTQAKFSIKAGLKNDLLKISFDCKNVDKAELKDILSSYRQRKQFHILKDGRVLILDDKSLKETDALMNDLDVSLDELDQETVREKKDFTLLEKSGLVEERDEDYRKLADSFEKRDLESIEVVEKYAGILRDYQVFGYRWLKLLDGYGFGGILADDMGLGKTLEMMAYLESMKGDGVSLVVAPASLVYNWADELKKFNSDLNFICVSGSAAQRSERIEKAKDYDLLITSYDYLRRDIELYGDLEFSNVVLDEAQSIKNHSTLNAHCVKALKARRRFAMSGTPIENNLSELWSLFDFIMPGYLKSYSHFNDSYEKRILAGDKDAAAKLHALVSPFILRRKKTEVLTELPEKIEQTHLIDFYEDEAKLYQALALQAVNELVDKKEKKDKIYILAEMSRLRRVCQDRRLAYEDIEVNSSKMDFCLELIDKIIANGEKTLVFSSFTSLFELLRKELEKLNIPYLLLTGENSKEQRKAMVDSFQSGDIPVFLISLKAGGTGLNLTSANNVIHFDPWWNMSATSQASDRTYRMGQKKTVLVHYLIMHGSIEEKIQQLQLSKKELSDTFIEGNDGTISALDRDDLLELFK